MEAIDFEFDGLNLSDFGFIICSFNSDRGTEIVSAGSKVEFEKISHNKGKHYGISSTQYNECITSTFDICKNPDLFSYSGLEITDREYRDVMRWLNRRELKQLHFYLNEKSYYFNASFNVETIKVADRLVGFRLTMETDMPFAYGDEEIVKLKFTDTIKRRTLYDVSDEIGYLYPSIKITCKASGNLVISNDAGNCEVVVKNCTNGEVITIDGESKIITSSLSSHKLYNDFNFTFFRIGNDLMNMENHITSSIACDVEIRYMPIVKSIF